MKWILITVSIILFTSCTMINKGQNPKIEKTAQPISHSKIGKLYYEHKILNNANNSLPTLIFIHGFGASSESWQDVIEQLSLANPIINIDLLDHGLSKPHTAESVSIAHQADLVIQLLNDLSLSNIVLIGHDIGGGIAQLIATREPERVNKMILINSIIDEHWPVKEIKLLRTPIIGSLGINLFNDFIWQTMLKTGFHNNSKVTDELIWRYKKWYQGKHGNAQLIENAKALQSTDLMQVSQAVRQIKIPTMILWSKQDAFLAMAPAEQLCTEMQHCQFQLLSNSGHFAPEETPELVAHAIKEFIQ